MSDEININKWLIQTFVYLPVGISKLASRRIKEAIEIGKQSVDTQVNSAKAIGQFTFDFGIKEATKTLKSVVPLFKEQEIPNTPETPNRKFISENSAQDREKPDLPIPNYDSLAASQIIDCLEGLTKEELEVILNYEKNFRARRTVLNKVAQLHG